MEQFKRAQVIMLPTKIKSNSGDLVITPMGLGYHHKDNKLTSFHNKQHLYIISDDEIKEGDWVYDSFNKKIYKATKVVLHNQKSLKYNYLNKITATTDISLINKCIKKDGTITDNLSNVLPQPSQQFIEKYIESYNKDEVITDVLVEYENTKTNNSNYPHKSNKEFNDNWKLKINYKDNTITIKKLKDSRNKEEIIELFNKFGKDTNYLQETGFPELDLQNWIKDNL